MTGPRISDLDFFTRCIDSALPGLETLGDLARGSNFAEARRLFARQVRASLQPEAFFTLPYEKGENNYMLPEETELQAADRILTHVLISCATEHPFGEVVDWEFNPTYNQYKEWTWQLNRHHEWKTLAFAYRETGEERYAAEAVRLFQSWVAQAAVPENAHGYDTKCWRTIECGIRMGANWPYILHALFSSPAFDDDVLVDWYKSVFEHGWRLERFKTTGNWLIMEMNGLGQIGILFPQFATAARWRALAFEQLEKQLDLQIYADGFQYELSTNYHEVVINNYFRLIHTAGTYGFGVPESFLGKLENACRVYLKLVMPNGCLPDLNDGRWAPIDRYLARRTGAFPNRPDFEWAIAHGERGKEPDYTSIALPWSGFAVMRTGWTPDACWALLDAAPFGRAHQHEDKLNLLLYACGKVLLTEAGNYAYDDSEMRRYVLSTRGHNTVRMRGLDQNRRAGYEWNDTDITKEAGLAFRSEAAFDSARATYDGLYGDDGLHARHSRTVLFIKDPAPFLLVVDEIECPAGEGAHEILWHIAPDETVQTDGLSASSEHLHVFCAGADALSLIQGQESPEWQGFVSTGNGTQGAYTPVPTLRYHVGGEQARVVTLLWPGAACPAGSLAVEGERVIIALRDGGEREVELSACRP